MKRSFRLKCRFAGEQSLGTGWFLDTDLVVTAFHVVGSKDAQDWFPGASYQIEYGDDVLPLQREAFDLKTDLAILRVANGHKPVIAPPIQALSGRPLLDAEWKSTSYPAFRNGQSYELFGRILAVDESKSAETLQLHLQDAMPTKTSGYKGASGSPIVTHGVVAGVLTEELTNKQTLWGASCESVRILKRWLTDGASIEESVGMCPLGPSEALERFHALQQSHDPRVDSIQNKWPWLFGKSLVSEARDAIAAEVKTLLQQGATLKENVLKVLGEGSVDQAVAKWMSFDASAFSTHLMLIDNELKAQQKDELRSLAFLLMPYCMEISGLAAGIEGQIKGAELVEGPVSTPMFAEMVMAAAEGRTADLELSFEKGTTAILHSLNAGFSVDQAVSATEKAICEQLAVDHDPEEIAGALESFIENLEMFRSSQANGWRSSSLARPYYVVLHHDQGNEGHARAIGAAIQKKYPMLRVMILTEGRKRIESKVSMRFVRLFPDNNKGGHG